MGHFLTNSDASYIFLLKYCQYDALYSVYIWTHVFSLPAFKLKAILLLDIF